MATKTLKFSVLEDKHKICTVNLTSLVVCIFFFNWVKVLQIIVISLVLFKHAQCSSFEDVTSKSFGPSAKGLVAAFGDFNGISR
jgi:hypothetical protein